MAILSDHSEDFKVEQEPGGNHQRYLIKSTKTRLQLCTSAFKKIYHTNDNNHNLHDKDKKYTAKDGNSTLTHLTLLYQKSTDLGRRQ